MRLTLSLLLLISPGCGPRSTPDAGNAHIVHVTPKSAEHVSDCQSASCGNKVNPPTGGPHCGTWLACRAYAEAQPRCSWIHKLEHGHAVLAYNCPADEPGCTEIVAALEAIRNRHSARTLLTPDPQLPARVAAIVWGWAYSGDVVDEAAIIEVLSHQDEEAPEPNLPCAP